MKNRLEELRRERGITQEELAAILEVSRQTISSSRAEGSPRRRRRSSSRSSNHTTSLLRFRARSH